MLGNPDRHSFANKARRIRREEIRRIHDQRYSIIPRIPTRHDWKKTSQMVVKCMLINCARTLEELHVATLGNEQEIQ